MDKLIGSTVISVEDWVAIRNELLACGVPLSTFAIQSKLETRFGFRTRYIGSDTRKSETVALNWYDAAKKTAFMLQWCDHFTILDKKKFNTGHDYRGTQALPIDSN